MKRDFFKPEDSGKMFTFAVLWSLVAQIVFALIITYVKSKGISESNFYLNSLGYLLAESSFLIVYFMQCKKNYIMPIKSVNITKKFDVISALYCTGIVLSLFLFTNPIFSWLDVGLQKIGLSSTNDYLINNWGRFLLSVVVLAVLPAIGEELVFRGGVFKGLKNSGAKFAVVMSAVCFTLMHMSIFQIGYQLELGIAFALVMLLCDDIKYSILMHFFNNFAVLLIEFMYRRYGVVSYLGGLINIWSAIILFVVGCALAVLFIWLLGKRQKQIKNDESLSVNKESSKGFWFYFAYGASICLVFIILGIVLV